MHCMLYIYIYLSLYTQADAHAIDGFAIKSNTLCHCGWVDPGSMPGTHQSCSITPSAGQGREKHNKRLVDRDKDRERSLTNYHHGQNRLNLGKLF